MIIKIKIIIKDNSKKLYRFVTCKGKFFIFIMTLEVSWFDGSTHYSVARGGGGAGGQLPPPPQ